MGENTILVVSIYAVLVLAGLGILGIALFGLRNLAYGKVEPLSIVLVALPGIAFVVLGFTVGAWAQAGIMTVIGLFGISLLGLVYTGITNLTW
jgi:hypothetical protein